MSSKTGQKKADTVEHREPKMMENIKRKESIRDINIY